MALVHPPDDYAPLLEITLQAQTDHDLALLDVQMDLEH
jgi:hypothetical protein